MMKAKVVCEITEDGWTWTFTDRNGVKVSERSCARKGPGHYAGTRKGSISDDIGEEFPGLSDAIENETVAFEISEALADEVY